MTYTKKMSIRIIERRLKTIRDVSGDSELAHCFEDDLRRDFLIWLSRKTNRGHKRIAAMAEMVLRSEQIPFDRWLA